MSSMQDESIPVGRPCPPPVIAIGERYGRLTVVSFAGTRNRSRRYECVCDCGGTTQAKASQLRNGNTRSCGCISRERIRERNTTHGRTGSGSHGSWRAMRERCLNPNHQAYHHYGGRGITVDPRWDDFANFFEDMGERPEGLTLDRIDPDGNYCKANCRWATRYEQTHNRRTFL